MDTHVRALKESCPGLHVATVYSHPMPQDVLGDTHSGEGYVPIEWLTRHTPLEEADIYVCGPKAFLRTYVTDLSMAGVQSSRIHYEFFGPADELMAA